MNYESHKSRVYILLDADHRVTRIEGEYSLPADLTGWTLIDEGYGDRYSLAQSHYLDGGLYTEDGLYRWKYVDDTVTLRTDDELAADRAAIPEPEPTPSVWDELDGAYSRGYREGVDAV